MTVAGETLYISLKTGTSNAGKDYRIAKFLDEEAEEFFTLFLDEESAESLKSLPKKTPVILTLEIVPGQKFTKFVSLELIRN